MMNAMIADIYFVNLINRDATYGDYPCLLIGTSKY